MCGQILVPGLPHVENFGKLLQAHIPSHHWSQRWARVLLRYCGQICSKIWCQSISSPCKHRPCPWTSLLLERGSSFMICCHVFYYTDYSDSITLIIARLVLHNKYMAHTAIYGHMTTCTVPYRVIHSNLMVWVVVSSSPILTCWSTAVSHYSTVCSPTMGTVLILKWRCHYICSVQVCVRCRRVSNRQNTCYSIYVQLYTVYRVMGDCCNMFGQRSA